MVYERLGSLIKAKDFNLGQPTRRLTWDDTDELTLSQTSPGFSMSTIQVFGKFCGKRRNCSLQAISPFPTVFSTLSETFPPFPSTSKL